LPEGIATNGTDVWIVDAQSDKVFKYAGAASRLSGSQNAASSFNLNSGNRDAKDVVTDGVSLWVVNESTTDKVFKYTVAGALVGSWTIGAANSKPTGITIDPSSVNDVWIVDSGTDRVYQYTGAASRTSGNQTAATSFALAAGNTNPQGIADPPVSTTVELFNARPSAMIANASTVRRATTFDRALEFVLDNSATAPNRSRPLYRPVLANADTTSANLLAIAGTSDKTGARTTDSTPHRIAIDAAIAELDVRRWPTVRDDILRGLI
jgi:hypothetical protein